MTLAHASTMSERTVNRIASADRLGHVSADGLGHAHSTSALTVDEQRLYQGAPLIHHFKGEVGDLERRGDNN